MLQQPDLAHERLVQRVQEDYGLLLTQVSLFDTGGDLGSTLYRATTDAGAAYFCKLRQGSDDLAAQMSSFLHAQGVAQIIPPLLTGTAQPSTRFHGSTLTVYPFVPGTSGYDVELSETQWADFGRAVGQIHGLVPPPPVARKLATEQYSPEWRSRCTRVLDTVDTAAPTDPLTLEFQALLRAHADRIWRAVRRADSLSGLIASIAVEPVLCHSDLHPGNLLLAEDGRVLIVDWDYPMLAPRERDLMFIGGGQGFQPYVAERERQLFFPSYQGAEPDPTRMTYYRYERGLTEVTVEAERVLTTSLTESQRRRALEILHLYFLPGGTLDIAHEDDEGLA
jgi:spectinomycin phosphotransferase